MILGILQLTYYNSEIDWKIGEANIMRCLEKYSKQWRLKQGNSGQQKQKDEEKKKETEKKQEEKKERKRKKPRKERITEVKRVAEE